MFYFEFKKSFPDGREKIVESTVGLFWYRNKKIPRENNLLPAVIFFGGRKEWYENGNYITSSVKIKRSQTENKL